MGRLRIGRVSSLRQFRRPSAVRAINDKDLPIADKIMEITLSIAGRLRKRASVRQAMLDEFVSLAKSRLNAVGETDTQHDSVKPLRLPRASVSL